MIDNSTARLALLACAAALASCAPEPDNSSAKASVPRTVKFVAIVERSIASGLILSGQLVPREEAAVAPQLSGYQVREVRADQGEWVKAGQVLALLDDTLLLSEIAQQRAAVAQARVSAEQAESEAARVASLDNSGVLSAEAIQQRRLAAKTARAQLAQAQALLDDKLVRDRLMTIRAPVTGRILDRTIRPGDVASPQSVMFRIARGGEIELNAEVPEQSLPLLRQGASAQIILSDGTQVQGRIRLISWEIDAQTRLGRARINLPVRDAIRAGGFAKAVLDSSATPVKAVREAAIRYAAEGASVTVIGKNNEVKARTVKVGRRGGGFAQLLEGPEVGARVLLRGQSFVLDGDSVKPVAATGQEAN